MLVGDKSEDELNGAEFEELTKVRSHDISKRIKMFYEFTEDESVEYLIYYDVANNTYNVTNIDPKETGIRYIEIGFISWGQVMEETGRNNTLYGGEYLYKWVNEQINGSYLNYIGDYEVKMKTFKNEDGEDELDFSTENKLGVGVLRYTTIYQ